MDNTSVHLQNIDIVETIDNSGICSQINIGAVLFSLSMSGVETIMCLVINPASL